MLPAANFAEKDGTFVNSARWMQWKWKAVDPPGEAKPDQEIIGRIFLKVRELYQQDGGHLSRSDPEPQLVVLEPGVAVARRSVPRAERLGARGREGRHRRGDRPPRPAALALPRHARRRLDALRQLALHRQLHRCRQHDAAAIDRRPERPRPVSRVDVQLAGEPARALQPRVGRRAGASVGCGASRHRLERPALGGRHAGLHRRQRARRRPRRVHHAARGRGAALRSRAVRRRPVVGALRADGVADRQSAAPDAELESGGASVHDQLRRARHRQGVPHRLHDLPPDRALPLLDEEQPVLDAAAAGVLRRDVGGAGAREVDRQRRPRPRAHPPAARSKGWRASPSA